MNKPNRLKIADEDDTEIYDSRIFGQPVYVPPSYLIKTKLGKISKFQLFTRSSRLLFV